MIVAAIPIKPFGVAKARLAPVLGPAARSRLGRAVAGHTADIAAAAGADVFVVTSDDGVEHWARRRGLGVIREEEAPGGLDAAASAAARHADGLGMPWAVVHADLPVATTPDLAAVFALAERGPVVAPSHDGGTNVIAGASRDFRFAYGPGSFHRHLARAPRAAVVVNPRLALDLDTPADLKRALAAAGGEWLRAVGTAG